MNETLMRMLAPVKPAETYTQFEFHPLHYTSSGAFEVSMEEVRQLELPPGIKFDDLVVRIEYGDYAEDGGVLVVGYNTTHVHPTPGYDKLLKKYEIDLAKHERELAAFLEKKQKDEQRNLKRKIAAARKLLREHGKLPKARKK